MKNFNSVVAALGLVSGFAASASAADLAAYRGQAIDLGPLNGVAYYTIEKDGYRVVATVADAGSNAVRFEAVLAPGQTMVLSSPAPRGVTPSRLEISRRDDRVVVQRTLLTN